MTRRSTPGLQQRLAEGVVLGDEGYVFELERRGYIQAGPYVPEAQRVPFHTDHAVPARSRWRPSSTRR